MLGYLFLIEQIVSTGYGWISTVTVCFLYFFLIAWITIFP
jgi:hypothetical protein